MSSAKRSSSGLRAARGLTASLCACRQVSFNSPKTLFRQRGRLCSLPTAAPTKKSAHARQNVSRRLRPDALLDARKRLDLALVGLLIQNAGQFIRQFFNTQLLFSIHGLFNG
jgi:hypothetical protein